MKTMPDKTFYTMLYDASNYTDRDAFASDWALSSVWDGDPREPVELAHLCGRVWDIAHLTVRSIRSMTGLTREMFAYQIGASPRTVETWEQTGKTPPYVIVLLARVYGLMDDLL